MPLFYVILHLLASALCFYAVIRAPARRAWTVGIAITAFAIVGIGFLIERRSDWAWYAISWQVVDLVFLTNFALEGSAVLAALLWKAATDKRQRLRACLLGVPLIAAALWSYAWFFEPLPDIVTGRIDSKGLCLQSSDDSCSAAAAVMLLHHYGIASTEAEMARLCLTRSGHGTSPLGLYRGLAIKTCEHGLHPKLLLIGRADRLCLLNGPVIIGVGLRAGTPPAIAARMQGYGWSFSVRHSVLIESAEVDGKWMSVADPTNGRERWPTDDLNYLWDGTALGLTR